MNVRFSRVHFVAFLSGKKASPVEYFALDMTVRSTGR